ncbi:hypothetical protein WMF30_10320 [Sorangium sp. So ce134]
MTNEARVKVELRAVPPDGAEVPDGEPVVDARGRVFVLRCPENATKADRSRHAEELNAMCGPGDVFFVLPHGYTLEVYRVVETDAC